MIRRFLLHASSLMAEDSVQASTNNHGMISGIGCLRVAKKRSNKVHNSAGRKNPAHNSNPGTATDNPTITATGTGTGTSAVGLGDFIPLLTASEVVHSQLNAVSASPRSESAKVEERIVQQSERERVTPASAGTTIEKLATPEPQSQPHLLLEPELIFPTPTPLLGSEEMDKHLTRRQIAVQVTTWNMGSLPLPHENQMAKLFGHEADLEFVSRIDVHVIGIQECWPDVETWELVLQTALGNGYALFHSLSFGTLHLSIFIRRDLLWFTTGK